MASILDKARMLLQHSRDAFLLEVIVFWSSVLLISLETVQFLKPAGNNLAVSKVSSVSNKPVSPGILSG